MGRAGGTAGPVHGAGGPGFGMLLTPEAALGGNGERSLRARGQVTY